MVAGVAVGVRPTMTSCSGWACSNFITARAMVVLPSMGLGVALVIAPMISFESVFSSFDSPE